MQQQPSTITVELTERRVPAPPDVQARRVDSVNRLNQLGHINAKEGQIPGDVLAGWDLRVNGTLLPVPVVAYEVVSGEHGPQVTVTIDADSVSVGRKPPVSTAEGRAARSWGSIHRADPRETIPGWAPEASND